MVATADMMKCITEGLCWVHFTWESCIIQYQHWQQPK